jgi:hypothetical protein
MEATYGRAGNGKWGTIHVLDSLRLKVEALSRTDNHSKNRVKQEMAIIINKILSIVDRTKKDLNMSRWVHMPEDSEEYRYYKTLCGNYEAFAYNNLGAISQVDYSEEGFNTMISNFKKARVIYSLIGMTLKIAMYTDSKKVQYISATAAGITAIKSARRLYDESLRERGNNSEQTIRTGLNYVIALQNADLNIDAERFVTNLANASCRV